MRGFTLIELVITISVAGILASLALPQFEELLRNRRLKSVTDQFYSQIVSARTEAVKRGSTVILCRTGDPLDLADGGDTPVCLDNVYPNGSALASKDWSFGWLVYATAPGFHGERNYNSALGDELLAVSDASVLDTGVTVTTNSWGNTWLTFQGDGTLNESGILYYAVCDSRGVNDGYLITVFMNGETRIDSLPTATVSTCSPPDS